MTKSQLDRRVAAVKTADAVNVVEGVPVSDYAKQLSVIWARGELTSEQMKAALPDTTKALLSRRAVRPITHETMHGTTHENTHQTKEERIKALMDYGGQVSGQVKYSNESIITNRKARSQFVIWPCVYSHFKIISYQMWLPA